VSGGNVGGRGEAQTIERLACGERLEGDHNVVRSSELKSLVAQTVLIISGDRVARTRSAQSLVRPHSTPTSQERIVCSLPGSFLRKVLYLMVICLYPDGKVFNGKTIFWIFPSGGSCCIGSGWVVLKAGFCQVSATFGPG
jgi:hypothetical protein